VAIEVGGVEEGDAAVDRCIDDRARRRVVEPGPEVVAAEADG
jgi:hypothetical protein